MLTRTCTIENLVGLESVIRVAFINSEHFVSVFFDLEKAYDQTWRHGIVMDMHTAGLRGNYLYSLPNSLSIEH